MDKPISVVLKEDGQGTFDSSTTAEERFRLEHALDNAESIVHGTFDLVAHEVVGASDNNRATALFLNSNLRD